MYDEIMPKDNNYKLYKHTTPNDKVYIGITKRKPKERWQNGTAYKNNIYFYHAIKKYGWDSIKHEVLHENLSKKEAEQLEIKLIAEFKSNNHEFGYNIAIGGACGSIGYEYTKEIREKMKTIARELKGKKVIQIIKDTKYFNEFPGDREWQYYDVDIEHTRKGKRYVATLEEKHIYNSLAEASEKTGASIATIYNGCKKTRRFRGNTAWVYYDEYITRKAIQEDVYKIMAWTPLSSNYYHIVLKELEPKYGFKKYKMIMECISYYVLNRDDDRW